MLEEIGIYPLEWGRLSLRVSGPLLLEAGPGRCCRRSQRAKKRTENWFFQEAHIGSKLKIKEQVGADKTSEIQAQVS